MSTTITKEGNGPGNPAIASHIFAIKGEKLLSQFMLPLLPVANQKNNPAGGAQNRTREDHG